MWLDVRALWDPGYLGDACCEASPVLIMPSISSDFCPVCRVTVLDARALGDPGFLGEARIDLASLALEPNSPAVNLWLPLKVRC